jgi:cellulose synthase (UDP-forming)
MAAPHVGLPAVESLIRQRVIHVVAISSLLVTLAYLTWRVGFTLGGDLWISIPLWLLELHAFLGLALFSFALWDVDSIPPHRPVADTPLRIAVLITTYDEHREVLLPTVAAALAMELPHETWLLDDSDRSWVRELASTLGARYLSRTLNTHAKAGSLNNALAHLDADVVAIFDADHVANSSFLSNTIGYFDEPSVAVVQTPQDFYNVDSFEHDRNRSWWFRNRRSVPYNEQQLFYRAIQPGKNRWNAAFWCGTNAVLRIRALRDIGGVAEETVTEDIHTTLRLHRRGWRIVYHNEVLAHGLAARDASQYQSQRERWGTGAMQLLRYEHPLSRQGLHSSQRIAYAATLLGWFDAWRSLGLVLVPLAVMFSGANPIHARFEVFIVAFAAMFLLQRLALALLSRGYAPQGMATVFEFVRLQSVLTATLSYLRRRERLFNVTDKGGAKVRSRNRAPWLLWSLLGLCLMAGVWFACSLAGLTDVTYPVRWAVYGAALWSLVNTILLIIAVSRIRADRFASDRRSAVRRRINGDVLVDSARAELVDISVGGALVRLDQVPSTTGIHELRLLMVDTESIVLLADERTRLSFGGAGTYLGLVFCEQQDMELARMTTALFTTNANIESVEDTDESNSVGSPEQ